MCVATNDDELEAELLALIGGKKGGGGKSKKSKSSSDMSLADIDRMLASVKNIGEGGDEGEEEGSLSDIDDDELLAELQVSRTEHTYTPHMAVSQHSFQYLYLIF